MTECKQSFSLYGGDPPVNILYYLLFCLNYMSEKGKANAAKLRTITLFHDKMKDASNVFLNFYSVIPKWTTMQIKERKMDTELLSKRRPASICQTSIQIRHCLRGNKRYTFLIFNARIIGLIGEFKNFVAISWKN